MLRGARDADLQSRRDGDLRAGFGVALDDGPILALLVTGLAIFRQLRAQRRANDLTVVTRFADEFLAEQMTRHKCAALMHLAEKRPGIPPSLEFVAGWFDGTAEARLLGCGDRELARRAWGQAAQFWGALAAPLLPLARATDSRAWASWERLVLELADRDREAGSTTEFTPELGGGRMSEQIQYRIERLRIEQDIKTGAIPIWPIPSAAAEPTVEAQA